MICSHPYNTWPLHVKLFTTEAEKAWQYSGNSALPRGFSCTLELEGVDGKSGHAGTGRKGPIDVSDSESTCLISTTCHNIVATSCLHLRTRWQMDCSPGFEDTAEMLHMSRAYRSTTPCSYLP